MSNIQIGIFGGTGFYSILENVEERWLETPYGKTSDKVAVGTYKGRQIAFIPRHGKSHSIPPHQINYRANVWAMKELGVRYIISPAAAGSLQKNIKPGDFVVTDQFVDRTTGRKDTFYDGPTVTHMPGAEPICPILRKRAIEALKKANLPHHETGTTVIIQGPRFSTKAESAWFTKMGWDVINMTMYPEAILARELEMCYTNISLITDYDSGLDGEFEPVTAEDAIRVFMENTDKLKQAVLGMVEAIELNHSCSCHVALKSARF
jgi:5'-methylthioadenosine phosphorylase